MSWTLTITGREHWLSGPKAVDSNVPSVREISHSLAQINRFTGHCTRPYSVAEHSLLVYHAAVADGAHTALQLAALMHDAHECITGDVATPNKREVGQAWYTFEDAQELRLLTHYGLVDVVKQYALSIRRWDLRALATERRDLTAFTPFQHTPWPVLDTRGEMVEALAIDLNAAWRAASPWNYWRDRMELELSELLERWDQEGRAV